MRFPARSQRHLPEISIYFWGKSVCSEREIRVTARLELKGFCGGQVGGGKDRTELIKIDQKIGGKNRLPARKFVKGGLYRTPTRLPQSTVTSRTIDSPVRSIAHQTETRNKINFGSNGFMWTLRISEECGERRKTKAEN